jgi:serine/threonine-protein kinase
MGIVHRDLKPDNIMIAKTRDGGDLVKVVDFGIAKAAGSDAQKVTKTGLVVGTPEYMSPEQLAGDKLDGRSDIYSLALVAFNMLTGKLPFPSDSAQESMIMRLTDKPKPLAEMRPEIAWPADVQAVMDKALERDAQLRYQSATAFAIDLYRAIDRMPETAAGEMGTQMLQVPPTRVGDVRASSPNAGATASVPTPVYSPPVTGAAALERKKSKVPLVGGIVLGLGLIVVAAVTIPPIIQGRSANNGSVSKDSTNGAVITQPAVTTPTPGTGSTPAVGDTARKSKIEPLTNPTNPSSNAAGGTIAQRLARLEEEAKDETRADDALVKLRNLRPELTNPNDKAWGNYVGFRAELSKSDTSKACPFIREALRLVTDPTAKSKYQNHADGSC